MSAFAFRRWAVVIAPVLSAIGVVVGTFVDWFEPHGVHVYRFGL